MKKPINDSIHVQMGGKMLHIKKSQFYAGGICFVFINNLGNLMKKFILSLITNMVGQAKCPLSGKDRATSIVTQSGISFIKASNLLN